MVDLDHECTWKMVHLTLSFSCVWKSCLSSQSYGSQPHSWVIGTFMMAIPHPLFTFLFSFYLVCMEEGHCLWLSPSRELFLCSWLESAVDARHEKLADLSRDTVILYFKSTLLIWDNSSIWFFLKSIKGNLQTNKTEFLSVCLQTKLNF